MVIAQRDNFFNLQSKFMKLLKVSLGFIFVLCLSTVIFAQKTKTLAENFSAETMDGQNVELDSLKGKVVVLTFWSTKCAICESEIPKLNKIANNFKGKDVVFLGLTTDNSTKVESYLKMRPFNFNIIPDSFGVLFKYADKDSSGRMNIGFPAYFVVNQAGEIEMKDSGWDKTEKLNTQINRLLTTSK